MIQTQEGKACTRKFKKVARNSRKCSEHFRIFGDFDEKLI